MNFLGGFAISSWCVLPKGQDWDGPHIWCWFFNPPPCLWTSSTHWRGSKLDQPNRNCSQAWKQYSGSYFQKKCPEKSRVLGIFSLLSSGECTSQIECRPLSKASPSSQGCFLEKQLIGPVTQKGPAVVWVLSQAPGFRDGVSRVSLLRAFRPVQPGEVSVPVTWQAKSTYYASKVGNPSV